MWVRGAALAVASIVSVGLGGSAIPAPDGAAVGSTCAVVSSTLSWGFKESFRSYVSGSIAHGEWTVADGATYETPLFGWSGGKGSFDFDSGEGHVGFAGSITFTGHEGVLATTVSSPRLRFVDDDRAVLLFDISGTTQSGESVDEAGVEFVGLDVSEAVDVSGNVLTVTDAPAVLLPEGARAFGTYEADEPFDPVSAELVMARGCAPVVTAESPDPAPAPPPETEARGPVGLWIGLGAALVALAAALAVILLRRRSS